MLVWFRLGASNYEGDPNLVLMLEALILDSGTWEGVPLTKRKTMSSNESSAILLWSEPCQWYSPLPEYKLPTAPGIFRLTLDVPDPSEFKYRYLTQACVRRMGRGRTVESREDMEDYRKYPYLTPNPGDAYCWLPDIWSTEP